VTTTILPNRSAAELVIFCGYDDTGLDTVCLIDEPLIACNATIRLASTSGQHRGHAHRKHSSDLHGLALGLGEQHCTNGPGDRRIVSKSLSARWSSSTFCAFKWSSSALAVVTCCSAAFRVSLVWGPASAAVRAAQIARQSDTVVQKPNSGIPIAARR
jgi:hypothetical protein